MDELAIIDINDFNQVPSGPLVQAIVNREQYEWRFSDFALPSDDPATISDARVKELVARVLEIEVGQLSRHKVGRPSTGNIMVQEVGVYG